ncbi:complex I NDUFA9 subunit family protein [Sphingomonas bacterium]|uniref:complex I NDUFA9 subunit family protein n=1 Tax=Sphingomonas bacterium TaxID=1895847 RepID=UPI0015772919|nr:complex I NDUFA9 subunit family protein [Sphingomonas bacterium]
MKNKLVTLIGGGGFLGRYVAQALMRGGARVRIAQRDPRQAYFLRTQGGLGQTQFAGVDAGRPDTILRAVQGSDAVVNLVGTFATGSMQALHVEGARAVARAAAQVGVDALVHISAIGADPAGPSVYARTKADGEAAVYDAFPRATILRPSVVFGPEDQFLNRFARMIETLPVVPVLRGPARFQPVYVADVAEAVLAALSSPDRFGGTTFELGGPDVVTMIGLQRWIAAQIDRKPRFLELPDIAGSLIASLPGSPIGRDQWLMLQRDTVATGSHGLDELGVAPTAMAAVAPGWLVRYHKAGRFGVRAAIEA